jgi:hypothetical protein
MPRKKSKKQIYADLLNQHRPTVRSFVLEILKIKLFNLQKGKQPVIPTGATWIPEEDRLKYLPLKYIALVNKQGIVVEMIRINEETANKILSKDIKLIPFDPKSEMVKKGMWYNNKKFQTKEPNEKED